MFIAEQYFEKDSFNLAFFDGHISFVEIEKGHYIASDYTVVPFKELYSLADETQGPCP